MADKNKWIRTAITVGVLIVGISISYATLKSNVDTLKADTTKLADNKLEKETFVEYKDRQDREFQEFKANQKETNEKLHSIDLKMVSIEEQLKQIIKAVNKK